MAAPPTLGHLAELIHHAVADGAATTGLFAYVRHRPEDGELDLGVWPLPTDAWPGAVLLGFVAPATWSAVALSFPGRAHHLDDHPGPPTRAMVTAIADRSGTDASVLAIAGNEPVVHHERAPGVMSDVLSRILERPTPPPQHSTAALVELTWMERVASGLTHGPRSARSWSWLADRHPLRGGGDVPEAIDLAIRTRAHAAAQPWSGVRATLAGVEPPDHELRPTGGVPVELDGWFDDGALSRWMLRDLPQAEATLAEARRRVVPSARERLDAALVALR